jgi:hypothetical protein
MHQYLSLLKKVMDEGKDRRVLREKRDGCNNDGEQCYDDLRTVAHGSMRMFLRYWKSMGFVT